MTLSFDSMKSCANFKLPPPTINKIQTVLCFVKIFDENSKFIILLQSTLVSQTSCYNVAFLRKQPTFGERKEHRNSILMKRHYPDLGSAPDWLNQISHAAQPIRSMTQIWVVTRHQYGISHAQAPSEGNQWKCRQMSAVFSG